MTSMQVNQPFNEPSIILQPLMAFNPEAPNFDRFPGRRDYPILLEPFADPSRISQPLMAFNSEAVNFNRLAGRREYPILIEPERMSGFARRLPPRERKSETTLEDRIRIMTAAELGFNVKEVEQKLGYSRRQVYYAMRKGKNPGRKGKCGRRAAIPDEKAKEIVDWLKSQPSDRRIPYLEISKLAPHLNIDQYGRKAIRTAIASQGYSYYVDPKKGAQSR